MANWLRMHGLSFQSAGWSLLLTTLAIIIVLVYAVQWLESGRTAPRRRR